MASSAKQIFIFFLLTLLSSLQIHARESQFFNKIPSNNSNSNNVVNKGQATVIPQKQEPNFTPENENGYGLYGHESGQLPPSASTPTTVNGQEPYTAATTNNYGTHYAEEIPNKRYLPKNYNPVAYVTVPEDNTDDTKFMDKEFTTAAANNRQYYNGDKESSMPDDTRFMDKEFTAAAADNHRYYNGGQESNMPDDTRFMDKEFTAAAADNHQYYTGVQKSSMPYDTRFMDKEFIPTTANNQYYYNGGKESSMPDDTRFMDKQFTTTSTADNHQYYNGGNNYYNNQESSMPEEKFMESGYTTTPTNTDNNYYNKQEETYPTTFGSATSNNHFNYNNGDTANRVQQQGMSDTRFLENGRYYYDVNTEKYVRNPYENSRNFAANSRNQFNNNEFNNNFMENNYQNVEEFQDEEGMP